MNHLCNRLLTLVISFSFAIFVFVSGFAQQNNSGVKASSKDTRGITANDNFSAPGSTMTLTLQTTTDCDSCGRNITVWLYNSAIPDTIYSVFLDSTGHGQRSGILKGHYKFKYVQFLCSSVIIADLSLMNDTTLNFSATNLKVRSVGPYVKPNTLIAQWNPPQRKQILMTEDWASGSFATNQWTTSGGTNWGVVTAIGNNAPSAQFSWSPQVTNYEQSLTSQLVSFGYAPKVLIKYDYYLSNYGNTTVNNLAVELWSGGSWQTLVTYNNQYGNIPWTSNTLGTTSLAAPDIRVRFRAYGADSYDINNWNIDNIDIRGIDPVWTRRPYCFLGENLYLNNQQIAFVTDTGYIIPPNLAVYGQQYEFCVKAVYNGGYAAQSCTTFICEYLHPPKSFNVTPLECAAALDWQKPDDSLARLALTGYNIYRRYNLIHHVSNPDSLHYDDLNLTPGLKYYSIEACYNLGVYGFPGQTGESIGKRSPDYQIHCGMPMPFHENFQSGNYSFNGWTFAPDQGNWGISNGLKNNAPFADFHWDPVRTNYCYAMESNYIDAYSWPCASLWLDLDYKLSDRYSTGNEKLIIEAWYAESWHTLTVLSNNGSVDWTPLHLDLSGAAGKTVKIRFVATGENSGDILHWYVDNINVYGICKPPSGLTASVGGFSASLTWNPPPCLEPGHPAGYNIYRKGPGNIPFFSKRNIDLVTTPSFQDTIIPGATYYYYVTAVSVDSLLMEPVCESAGTDTVVFSTVAVAEKQFNGPRVYPNPASGMVTVQSDGDILGLEVLNFRGQRIYSMTAPAQKMAKLDVSSWPPGLYLFRVTDCSITKTVKVMITH